MSELTIYHNPRCSKSRATLELLQEQGFDPIVVRYLDQPPDLKTLRELRRALGCPVIEMMRPKEAVFSELELSRQSADADLLQAIVEHPILLERPIVRLGDQAAIGRPPERVLGLLQ